jgi:hypothetical protein
MRNRIFVIASLMLALAAVAFAADDPFTGTWRETTQMIIKPNGEGISREQGGLQIDIHYGKDIVVERTGATIKMVRVDDHTLKTTVSSGGKIVDNITTTVSPDGKHYTQKEEHEGTAATPVEEYERVGPVPSGDAFWGTWRRISPPLDTYTIKIDGDLFDNKIEGPYPHSLTTKLDGKESKIGRSNATEQAKRIDAQTIEMIEKSPEGLEVGKILFQVKGDTLIETNTLTLPDRKPIKLVRNFVRVK